MPRPTLVTLRLDHLRHNFAYAQGLHGSSLLAVIKANAYGHGAVDCAQALAPLAQGFAVANLEEALPLRAAGITHPIVILQGPLDLQDLAALRTFQLSGVFHARQQLEWLEQRPELIPPRLWLKLDTGMHRLGLSPDEYLRWLESRPLVLRTIRTLVLMTHFASADTPDPAGLAEPLALTQRLKKRTSQLYPELPLETSLANSGAVLRHPAARGDWGRPGLMLYGVDPAAPGHPSRHPLLPVMSLTSALIAVRTIASGEQVGYGGIFRALRPTRVGVVACGYGDGYPRSAAQGTPVAVSGQLLPLIGRVSMDMITVDLTGHSALDVGAPVELWGTRVAVAEVAERAGTVAYELLCRPQRPARRVLECAPG